MPSSSSVRPSPARPIVTRSGGFVMAIVLVFLTVLTITVFLAASMTRTNQQVIVALANQKKAFFAAEAGITEALLRLDMPSPTLVTVNGQTFDAAIQPNEGNPDWETRILLGNALPAPLASPPTTPTIQLTADQLAYSTTTSGDDALRIRWVKNGSAIRQVDGSNVLEVVSVGRAGRARQTVRVQLTGGDGACGMIIDREVEISGNPTLLGTAGCIHTNDKLKVSGNPIMAQGPTSSGTMDISGNPTFDGTPLLTGKQKDDYEAANQNQAVILPPKVCPFRFGPNDVNLANRVRDQGSSGYRLDSNCRVYRLGSWSCTENPPNCSGGTQIANLSNGGSWGGWECSDQNNNAPTALWKVSSSTFTNGAYFVEGWVNISGNPGLVGPPWRATIVALNSIDVSGSPVVIPFVTSGDLANVLYVTGNDLMVSGNAGASGKPGAIFAHQQIKFNGNPTLNGMIVAEDGRTTCPGDPAPNNKSFKDIIDKNQISGNFVMTVDGNNGLYAVGGGSSGYEVIAWGNE